MNDQPTNESELHSQQQPVPSDLLLLQVLGKLTEKLANSGSTVSHEQILIKLLMKIDNVYFQPKFVKQQNNYEGIVKCIGEFYRERLGQIISKVFFVELNYGDKFQIVFQLVWDLAMNCNQKQKQRYIDQILHMEQHQKQILLPYINEITQRKFVQKIQVGSINSHEKQPKPMEFDQIIETKEQEYQELKQHYEELQRGYSELNENYQNLKVSFEKLSMENNSIHNQKYQMMNQFGLHHTSTYFEVVEKYRKDLKLYQMEIQRLNKEIEYKNIRIRNKEIEVKKTSEGNINAWQKQKQQLLNLNKKFQQKLKQYEDNQQQITDQLQNSKMLINKLLQDMEIKDKQINNLLKIKNKYQYIKESHLEFKRNFVQRMKES